MFCAEFCAKFCKLCKVHGSVSHIRVRPSPPRKYHPLGKMFAAWQLLEATTPVILAVRSPSILDAFNSLDYGGTVDCGGTCEG